MMLKLISAANIKLIQARVKTEDSLGPVWASCPDTACSQNTLCSKRAIDISTAGSLTSYEHTETPTVSSYHWVNDEAATHYLHAVHHVADGFTRGYLCR